jgi:predicted component of type VI protein secretion system
VGVNIWRTRSLDRRAWTSVVRRVKPKLKGLNAQQQQQQQNNNKGTAGEKWLRYCATNWKVAGSIPDGVTGIFH